MGCISKSHAGCPGTVCGEKELAHEAPCGDDGCMRAYVGAMSRPILSHDPSLEKTSMHSATASVGLEESEDSLRAVPVGFVQSK